MIPQGPQEATVARLQREYLSASVVVAPASRRLSGGRPARRVETSSQPPLGNRYFLNNKSPAMKMKNTTEITPFMVKNAAFSLERLLGETSECS